jgi:hypothetical protein
LNNLSIIIPTYLKTYDDLYFKSYSINYKNPQANTYNYTGLTAASPEGISLLIAYSGWSSSKPTGLYISTSTTPTTSSILASVEQSTTTTGLGQLIAIGMAMHYTQLYIFDRREAAPSDENTFYLFIYPLKYRQS